MAFQRGLGLPGRPGRTSIWRGVVGPYLAFGVAWILISDRVIGLFARSQDTVLALQSIKGVVFVAASALLIHLLVRRAQRTQLALQVDVQAQRDRLAHILEVSPTLIYALVADAAAAGGWRVEFISDNTVRVTGFSQADWRGGPDFLRQRLHPDDLARYDADQRLLREEGALAHSYRFRHADGTYRWIDDHVLILRDAQGAPHHLIGAWLDVTERRQAELAVAESAQRYQALFDANPLPMWVHDQETLAFVAVNGAAEAAYGYTREAFLAMTLPDLHVARDHARLHRRLAAARQAGTAAANFGEWRHRRQDGSEFWAGISGQAFMQDGRPMRLVVVTDATQRRRAREQLRLIGHVFQFSHEGIFITDAKTRFISVNRSFTTITGYTLAEVEGQTPRLLQSGRQSPAFYDAMWARIHATGRWEGELWNRRKTGEIYPEWLTISAIRDGRGEVRQYLGIFTETSGRKAAEERIQHLSHHDALTGLPNAVLLADRAEVAFAAAGRHRSPVVLMHLNIDHFGAINESYGHELGDQVLCTVAQRLQAELQPDDSLSRRGADDFIVLLPDTAARAVMPLALRLRDAVAEPLSVGGQTLRLTSSIGIAEHPLNGTDLPQLLQAAESAVHQAKRDGRNGLRYFSREGQDRVRETLALEHDLRDAVGAGQLRLHYQAQVDAHSQRIVGLEALVRWQHPQRGLVSPARFIPLAEATGLIRPIGQWVIEEALRQTAAWQAAGLAVVPVAVNLSLAQFRDPALLDMLVGALQRSGVSAELLELELTESVAMEDAAYTIATIDALKQLGLLLSIDDFGTGYSSLSHLKRYAVDRLKIDQSFVRGLNVDADDEAIVKAVIGLARSLDLRTVAEGVETRAQLDFLRAHGCDEIQGYLFCRPIPGDDLAHLLARGVLEPAEPTGAGPATGGSGAAA